MNQQYFTCRYFYSDDFSYWKISKFSQYWDISVHWNVRKWYNDNNQNVWTFNMGNDMIPHFYYTHFLCI